MAAHFSGKGSSPLNCLAPLSKISWTFIHLGLFPGPVFYYIHLYIVFMPANTTLKFLFTLQIDFLFFNPLFWFVISTYFEAG